MRGVELEPSVCALRANVYSHGTVGNGAHLAGLKPPFAVAIVINLHDKRHKKKTKKEGGGEGVWSEPLCACLIAGCDYTRSPTACPAPGLFSNSYLIPPAKSNKKAARNVLHRPEVDGNEDGDDNKVDNKRVAKHGAEDVSEQGCQLEQHVEKHNSWVLPALCQPSTTP